MPYVDPSLAGCCVWDHEGQGSEPARCPEPVAWAGAVEYINPRRHRVRAFACAQHVDRLLDPRPYGESPAHEVEKAARRERDRRLAEEAERHRRRRKSQWAV